MVYKIVYIAVVFNRISDLHLDDKIALFNLVLFKRA